MQQTVRRIAKSLPGFDRIKQSSIGRLIRHRLALREEARVNSHFTGFRRLPTQFEALTGPVLDFLRESGSQEALEVVVAGCSNGAEVYSISKALWEREPRLEFRITGIDIDPTVLQTASSGRYDADTEVHNNKRLPANYVEEAFDRDGEVYSVKPHLRESVSFSQADMLDDDAVKSLGKADVVFAQNVLFHLSPKEASHAFANLVGLLKARGAIFVDGMDVPLRARLSREYELQPLDYCIEDIHNEARWARAVGWPEKYWGLEPFGTVTRNWQRRYATIFLKYEQ